MRGRSRGGVVYLGVSIVHMVFGVYTALYRVSILMNVMSFIGIVRIDDIIGSATKIEPPEPSLGYMYIVCVQT